MLDVRVLPALPGTRALMVDGTRDGVIVAVHGWVMAIDVDTEHDHDDEAGTLFGADLSSVVGHPLILNAGNELQVAAWAEVDYELVEVIEPGWEGPSDHGRHVHDQMLKRRQQRRELAQR